MAQLQNAASMLIGSTPRTKNLMWRHKNRKYASRLLSFVAHIISRVPRHKIATAIAVVFELEQFNSTKTCIVGCCLIPEIGGVSHYTGNRYGGRPNRK